ncbi:MAG TPA: AraC family transcriptional regulator [Solirubrobacteraceae bacterium]
MEVMHGDEAVRVWRADVGSGALCMHGTTASYAVDPVGEYVVGIVLAGGMRVRRGREVHRFAPGDVCAWDPSARHEGRPWRSARWQARLVVLELPDVHELVRDPDAAGADVALASPRVRDPRLALGFLELHAALEQPAWRLERDTLLQEWLCALAGPDAAATAPRAARRDPALRRACELVGDDLARNLTLSEVAATAGVSRHRLTRLFRAAYGLPPHRFVLAQRIRAARRLLERGAAPAEAAAQAGFFDQSHLHRHFVRTLGMTPAAYAAALRSDVQDAGRRAP